MQSKKSSQSMNELSKSVWKVFPSMEDATAPFQVKGYRPEMNQAGFFDFKEHIWTELDVENLPEDVQLQQKKASRPMLIMVNPQSGKKQSLQILAKSLQPLLQEFSIDFETFITSRAHQAEEYLQNCENLLEKYSAVVIVSGDGLLFEVIQGLGKRPDKALFEIPLGIIPAGSGNGLAKSLSFFKQETFSSFHSSLNIVSQRKAPMDLVKVRTDRNEEMYSFLSVGWGFTSDCDIESECLRFLGEYRFFVYSVRLLLELRSYRARISYKLVSGETRDIEDDFVIIYLVKQPWVTSSFFIAPQAKMDDGSMWLFLLRRKNVNRLKMLKIMLGFENAKYLNVDGVEMLNVKSFTLNTLTRGSYITVDGEKLDSETRSLHAEILPEKVKVLLK